MFYAFDLIPLTTGKTGITIYASESSENNAPLDAYLARNMGDKLLSILNPPKPKEPLPFKVKTLDPRSEPVSE